VAQIRRAEREDLDALFALDQVCFPPGIAYPKIELRYFLFHPAAISLVLEDGGRITGFAIGELGPKSAQRTGHIVTIDVDPSLRRRGMGQLLMDALLDGFKKAGVAIVQLEVAVDNDGAQAFYTKLGFTPTGRIRGFYMGKLDALRMELDLK
jgi:[ribosomal protein S18]-alanine N-acetyltransferase